MKTIVLRWTALAVCLTLTFYALKDREPQLNSSEQLREQHEAFLEASIFKDYKHLTTAERKALALPPNGYNEQVWELTMDPRLGRPTPERALEVQNQLRAQRNTQRGVGGDASNPWVDRGPNNIGGRTRGIMFDPNDTSDYNRVFAGGISGGLWVNNDITDPNASWTLVPGIGSNIAVNTIIYDPNNTNTFYIGSGESYTSGNAIGNGIWKSTDGGVTWSQIFGGYTGTSNGNQQIDGIFYINDMVARDVGASTELYISVAGAFYGDSGGSPNQWHSLSEQGVYKSVDNGSTWTKFTINEANGTPSNPNDLEIDINNNIWVTTTTSSWGFPGGKILRSTNGTSFSLMHTVPNAGRTEIECSQNSANTLWVLASISSAVDIFTTTDAFTSVSQINTEPNDADPGISSTDFTRGQAFYDLEIEADANDNLLVGGIDLFLSTNNGASWGQISEWYNIGGLTASFVHADQQAIVFRPGVGNENKVVFGTDGGVFYCDDITTALGNASAISARNKDYNTVQFYYGDITSVINGVNDDLIGGTQDNGTPAVYDAIAGANSFTDITGGDGGYTEIDDAGNYIVTAYPTNDHYVLTPPNNFYRISSTTGGNFINEAALDKNLDILYTNSSITSTATYQIERIATFTAGPGSVVRTTLSDATLNASPSAFKVSPYTVGSTKLYVGLVNGRLLRIDTANTAPSWNLITGPGFVGSVSDIEFGQSESEIFVTMHNYGVTSIWFSNDGGATWQNKEGNLPDVPVKCILQNPLIANEVIVGTQLGVWATSNYTAPSPVWIQVYNGMNDVPVLDLDLRSSDHTILATTHGRGMFTSQFTAVALSDGVSNALSEAIRVYPTVVTDAFNIKTSGALGVVSVELFTVSGQSVFKDRLSASETLKTFNLDLQTGIYMMRLTANGSSVTKRLIVK